MHEDQDRYFRQDLSISISNYKRVMLETFFILGSNYLANDWVGCKIGHNVTSYLPLLNLPTIFRKYCPKCWVIIDYADVFIENFDMTNMYWLNYEHHSKIKCLVGIKPNVPLMS